MMAANLVVLLRQSCLISPVDSSLYLFNLFDTFLQLFVMMIQNRYNDGLEWHQLDGNTTGRDVEFRMSHTLSNPFLSFLSTALRNGFYSFFFHCKCYSKCRYSSTHLAVLTPPSQSSKLNIGRRELS